MSSLESKSTPGEATRRTATAWAWVVATALFAYGILNVPLRIIGWDGDGLPGDGIDSTLNNFMLEHGYRSLRGQARFWFAPMFYPAPGMTGTTDPHIAMTPVYSLMRVAGLSPERAFQGWFLLAFVLNFVSAIWAAHRLGFSLVPAAAAAYVFTFSLPVAAQVPHPQLLHRWLVPPAVVTTWHFLHAPNNRRFGLIVACWFGQFLLTVYIAFFLALLLLTLTVLTFIRQYRTLPWRELVRANWRIWGGRVLIVLAILPPLGSILIRHALVSGATPRDYMLLWAPEPITWLTVPPHAMWTAAYKAVGIDLEDPEGERRLFPGWLPYAALLVALWGIFYSGKTAIGQRWLVVALLGWASLLLALWVTQWGDYWLYDPFLQLPGFRQIRAVGRVILVLLFPLGLAVAAILSWLLARWPQRWAVVAVSLGLLIMAIEQTLLPTSWEEQWYRQRHSLGQQLRWQKQLETAIRSHPRPKLLYVFPSELPPGLPQEDRYYRLQVIAMRAAQNAGIPCVNGYSGYIPVEWDIFFGYRTLFEWLTQKYSVPAEQLRGLVLIGEPEPDGEPEYEGIMRQAYPPVPLPPWE